MNHAILKGRSILLVEDELLIAMDVTHELETAGAAAMSAIGTLRLTLTPIGKAKTQIMQSWLNP